jgi:hypothetical protein
MRGMQLHSLILHSSSHCSCHLSLSLSLSLSLCVSVCLSPPFPLALNPHSSSKHHQNSIFSIQFITASSFEDQFPQETRTLGSLSPICQEHVHKTWWQTKRHPWSIRQFHPRKIKNADRKHALHVAAPPRSTTSCTAGKRRFLATK